MPSLSSITLANGAVRPRPTMRWMKLRRGSLPSRTSSINARSSVSFMTDSWERNGEAVQLGRCYRLAATRLSVLPRSGAAQRHWILRGMEFEPIRLHGPHDPALPLVLDSPHSGFEMPADFGSC